MPATVVSVTPLAITGRRTGIDPTRFSRIRYYSVVLSAADENGDDLALGAAAQALGLPADGDTLSGTGLVVVSRRADPEPGDDSGENYRAEIEYGQNAATFGGTGTGEPWDAEVRIGFGSVIYERVLNQDFAATPVPVVNKVGDPFEPPIMFRQYNRLLKVRWTKRRSEFDPFDAQALLGSLNSAGFSIRGKTVAAEKALLHNVDVEDAVWSNGTQYYNISAEIEIERDVVLKNPKRANKGYRELRSGAAKFCTDFVWDSATGADMVGPDGAKVRVAVSSPVWLKSSDGTRYTGTTPETDCTVQFVEHRTASWADLALP
jgi:hypothetical protein